MTATIPAERVDFVSRRTRVAAWLTRPPSRGPHPAIVLVHGLGATHDMALARYEQHFAAAGIATLAFDYRHTGASDGQPRQHISAAGQQADVAAALAHLESSPGIDGSRMGLWGTSLGAMHAIAVAARVPAVAATVVQCPIVHGPGAARRLGAAAALRMVPAIVDDGIRALTRRTRRHVPIVGAPGSGAMVTVPGAEAGWYSTVDPGGVFDNRIIASDALGIVAASVLRRARRVQSPVLVCVCDGETLMNPRYAESVARRAPQGVVRHYDSDHFQIYHPPLLAQALADQTAFLREHLDVRG